MTHVARCMLQRYIAHPSGRSELTLYVSAFLGSWPLSHLLILCMSFEISGSRQARFGKRLASTGANAAGAEPRGRSTTEFNLSTAPFRMLRILVAASSATIHKSNLPTGHRFIQDCRQVVMKTIASPSELHHMHQLLASQCFRF